MASRENRNVCSVANYTRYLRFITIVSFNTKAKAPCGAPHLWLSEIYEDFLPSRFYPEHYESTSKVSGNESRGIVQKNDHYKS